MTEIANVSGTAFIIAEFRAAENQQLQPLYLDDIVQLFLNEQTHQAAGEVLQVFPPAKDAVAIRTKYFDDTLSAQIALGCQQVVILGAGLDTRAVRKQALGVTYFEIDHPATLKLKAEVLQRHHLTAMVKYIPGDYVRDDIISLLQQHNFDPNLPTYLLWEGNSVYLTKAEIIATFRKIRDYIKSFKFSFDYMSERVIARTTGCQELNDYIDKFIEMGAPWLTGFADITELAESLNLQIVEHFSTAELSQKYCGDRALESNLFDFYFLGTLEKVADSS